MDVHQLFQVIVCWMHTFHYDKKNLMWSYGLHTVCEALQDTFSEGCIRVLPLQLLVQDVNMRLDLMKQDKKNFKSRSRSIFRKPDASLRVVLPKDSDVLMDSKHRMRSSRFSYTALTILLLKFHLVDEALGSLRATIWSRMLVCLGDWVNKEKRLEKKPLTAGMWEVTCSLIKGSWCTAAHVIGIFEMLSHL